ncbi:NAD(P)/FAD-dependent oxidoreductase [uncultured Microbacterium sp.]|uniref:NAD(P)/FAD-dependent oxidoreductase n=1 Tax=uncultured Microbacterium sp. TaxID=191216 RepID=UPI002624B1E7|nr:NAD(P)/FAD-dependent oxidoreductase [uncultured Microbacterium sp.]
MTETSVDALIIGGGPAGLSAALNLARARTSVLVADTGRPRNAATLRSHGFLTRDGISPIELRKLARAELDVYPAVRVLDRTSVTTLTEADAGDDARFTATLQSGRSREPRVVSARSVLIATGLRETLPAVPSLRSFYGMTLFSCAACDAWELQDRPLALIGETPDLPARARLLARWTDDLAVFTNGAGVVDTVEEAELAASGIVVERRPIADLEGDRGQVSGVLLTDGTRIPIAGGFVRPRWEPALDFLAGLDVRRDSDGHLLVDRSGRTTIAGLYGAGDAAAPGPQQLIVAAGQGARAAAVMVHDMVGVRTTH